MNFIKSLLTILLGLCTPNILAAFEATQDVYNCIYEEKNHEKSNLGKVGGKCLGLSKESQDCLSKGKFIDMGDVYRLGLKCIEDIPSELWQCWNSYRDRVDKVRAILGPCQLMFDSFSESQKENLELDADKGLENLRIGFTSAAQLADDLDVPIQYIECAYEQYIYSKFQRGMSTRCFDIQNSLNARGKSALKKASALLAWFD